MLDVELHLTPVVLAELLRTSMAQGQRPYLTITSGSMRPLLQIEDEVQLEPVAFQELQPGDIITVAASGSLLTHRFWGHAKDEKNGESCLVTRGDRFLTFDTVWPPAYLVGRVVVRRRQKRWLLSLREGYGGWLDRHVAHIAAAESRLFNPDRHPVEHISPALISTKTTAPFYAIQVRRLIYLWVTLVVNFVGLIARKPQVKSG